MLLEITTTHRPATDLGYLLAKNPARVQTFDVGFGDAHVFYPEATEERCTAALLVDLDPVGLTKRRAGHRFDYVNDRPYAASSFLSVAMNKVLRSAMTGTSRERPELAEAAIPLVARLPVVPTPTGPEVLHRLFVPLGYEVEAIAIPLDEAHPEWGDSRYVRLRLTAQCRLADLLEHLYVLLPVLDDDKHYFIGDDEVDKIVRRGGAWLTAHPEREWILDRALGHRRGLARAALEQLLGDETADADAEGDRAEAEERAVERPLGLHAARIDAVTSALREAGARRVLDVGCGEGKLVRALLDDPQFATIAGMDASPRALERAARRLRLDRLREAERDRVTLFQGALTYSDERLAGYDAAAAVEVVEHLDPSRLPAFEQVLFGGARPGTVVVTTPNVEYNPRFAGMAPGALRHRDHRFEWTRAEFSDWTRGVGERYGYRVRTVPIGPEHPEVGPPTQMAVFTR